MSNRTLGPRPAPKTTSGPVGKGAIVERAAAAAAACAEGFGGGGALLMPHMLLASRHQPITGVPPGT